MTVEIERCYKGQLPKGTLLADVDVTAPNSPLLPRLLIRSGEYALFFLSGNQSPYTMADRWFGALEIAPTSNAKGWSGADPLAALEADLEAGLSDQGRNLVIDNLQVLGGLHTLRSRDAIHALVASQDTGLRGEAILALMRTHDSRAVGDALSFLSQDPPSARISNLQLAIRNQFELVNDPATLKILHDHLASPHVLVRSAIVKALKNLQSGSSVPWLIALLDDSDTSIRFDAMVSLVLIENKGDGWATSWPDFQANGQKYIAKWKDWWSTEGRYQYQ
jgi:hypothetical protein